MNNQATISQLEKWLNNDMDIQIFLLFLEEQETNIDQLLEEPFFELKKKVKLSEFKQWAQTYFKSGETLEKQVQSQETIKQKLKSYVDKTQIKKSSNKQTLVFGLENSLVDFFINEIKQKRTNPTSSMEKQRNLQKRFEDFFIKFFKLMWKKNPEKSLLLDIKKFGTFQAVKSNRCFVNQDTKDKFQKMLEISKSYKSLKLYGGQDFQLLRQEVFQKLKEQLIKMNAPTQMMSMFLEQLIKNPVSNCIADYQYLSSRAKSDFYLSPFYQSGKLAQYAQLNNYPQSLHSKATAEVNKIIKYIQQGGSMITPEITSKAFNFDLIALLKIPNMAPIKKSIFNYIQNQCPNYYKLFLLAQYQQKKQLKFRNNRQIQLRFALRKMFLEVHLIFEQWQQTEDQLMSRKENIIQGLQLTLQAKQKLRRFYLDQIQAYFHAEEKPLKYPQQLQHHLLVEIMNSSIETEKNMTFIQRIIKEIVETQSMLGPIAQEQLTIGCKKDLSALLANSALYQQYVSNKGVDAKEEEYLAKLKIKKQLYDKNAQDQVQYSYNYIQKQVNQIYKQSNQVILAQSSIPINPSPPINPEINPVMPSPVKVIAGGNIQNNRVQLINKKQNLKKRDQLVVRLKNVLQNQCSPQSKIISIKNEKFSGKELEYFERLIISNPFNNQKIEHSELGINAVIAKRLVTQCQQLKKNNNQLSQLISQYQLLDEQIQFKDPSNSSLRFKKKESGSPSNVEKQESPQKQKKLLLQQFFNHIKKYKQSTLLKVITEKCNGKNYQKLLSKALSTNLFSDANQEQLKNEFDITKLQLIKMKKQLPGITKEFEKDVIKQYEVIRNKVR